jgi:hypothetical protein
MTVRVSRDETLTTPTSSDDPTLASQSTCRRPVPVMDVSDLRRALTRLQQ